ncbi:nuclear pore complex protein an-nup120 [Lasallia pustulata]|uniref:Nuclear pore complex protein an-nup120 n=1 Tax=Lasallia pustulata TaxID=136370 RepID=A0A1W5CXY6_9LECA|nr:nuclear pore complex protein an-nup120 [Lasallia pustulata]
MAPLSPLCVYKENRVDLQPLRPSSIVHVQLSALSVFGRGSQNGNRRVLTTLPRTENEGRFSERHLATSSSIYFRKSNRYPRSLLWRILENDQVLEIRSVDLSKSEQEHEDAAVILRIGLPSTIIQGGVALADPEDGDSLNIFVLTKGNELYTFSLRPEFFYRTAATEEDIGKWCKVFRPASFSISSPHRLVACSYLELVVSLGDGKLMRLARKAGSDGSTWHESTYNDGQWGSSLRGLIRWQGSNTVRYNGQALDQATAVAMASSPDGKHILSVCLNHTLKAWNLVTGKVGFIRDLLNQHRDPQDISKVMLNPGTTQVLQVLHAEGARNGDQYYVVTFSPQDGGSFKIWAIRDADEADVGVRDLYPEAALKSHDPDPDPNSGAIWTMADFRIKDAQGGEGLKMCILMRSNRQYKLYTLKFDLDDLPRAWHDGWVSTTLEAIDEEAHPRVWGTEPADAMDKWSDFLFRPGKFPDTVLDTALSTWCQSRNITLMVKDKKSIKERICSSVGSLVSLQQGGRNGINFHSYREAIDEQWNSFWNVIKDLEQRRWEIVSLSYDDHADMPWIVYTDGCSPVRSCSRTELIAHNDYNILKKNWMKIEIPSVEVDEDRESQEPEDLHQLIEAAAGFRHSFDYPLYQSCMTILNTELWQDASQSMPNRIQSFYDEANFAEEIGDRQCSDLATALDAIGGFDGLDTDSVYAIIEAFPTSISKEFSGLLSTSFGLKVLVKGVQEMIELHSRILVDLLILTVFVDVEMDREETPMKRFNGPQIYSKLLKMLRKYQMMQWLSKSTRPDTKESKDQPTAGDMMQSTKHPAADEVRVSTVLENLFATDTKPQSYLTQPESVALSQSIQDVLSWITADELVPLESILVHIQCNLLANGNIDLASDFLRYQPSTAWATYVKGRLYLARGEFSLAAINFRKAAFNLARHGSVLNLCEMSHGLLTTLESAHFSSGLPPYYLHILSLFESFSAYTHVSTFASLALQLLPAAKPQSPSDRSLHQDLLCRLFHASLRTTAYDSAYTALLRYTDSALQSAALAQLISTMIAQDAASQLLRLPFPGLAAAVDAILEEKAHKTLDVHAGPAFHKILYAWRLRRGDFRGAAAVLFERLQRLRRSGPREMRSGGEGLLDEYLVLINVLACVGEGQAWVLAAEEGAEKKRRVVTLEEVRGAYQEELERRSVLESGRFALVGGDGDGGEMDLL